MTTGELRIYVHKYIFYINILKLIQNQFCFNTIANKINNTPHKTLLDMITII